MNDQLLNSYYYTPHFSNYVVRSLSFCLLGWGGGRQGKKREEKGRETVFLLPSLFLYSPPVSDSPACCERQWVDADPTPAPACREGAGLNEVKLCPVLFHRAECVLGRRKSPCALAGLPVTPCVSGLDVAAGAQWLGLVLGAAVVFPPVLAWIWDFLPGKGLLRFPANKLPANQPRGADTLPLIASKPSSQLSCSQSHTGVRAAFPAGGTLGAGASLQVHAVPQELMLAELSSSIL